MTVYYRDTIGAIAVYGVEDVTIAGEDVYITALGKDITIRLNQLAEITDEEVSHEDLR